MSSSCLARREQDQMRCARCRLAWDLDDPEPPVCPNTIHCKDERIEVGSQEHLELERLRLRNDHIAACHKFATGLPFRR